MGRGVQPKVRQQKVTLSFLKNTPDSLELLVRLLVQELEFSSEVDSGMYDVPEDGAEPPDVPSTSRLEKGSFDILSIF